MEGYYFYDYKTIILYSTCYLRLKQGQLVGKSAGLVIDRLRVRVPAGAAGECSFQMSTLCADSYSVSVPPPCYRNGR